MCTHHSVVLWTRVTVVSVFSIFRTTGAFVSCLLSLVARLLSRVSRPRSSRVSRLSSLVSRLSSLVSPSPVSRLCLPSPVCPYLETQDMQFLCPVGCPYSKHKTCNLNVVVQKWCHHDIEVMRTEENKKQKAQQHLNLRPTHTQTGLPQLRGERSKESAWKLAPFSDTSQPRETSEAGVGFGTEVVDNG